MAIRVARRTSLVVALFSAVIFAARVPAEDGGLFPTGLLILVASARALAV